MEHWGSFCKTCNIQNKQMVYKTTREYIIRLPRNESQRLRWCTMVKTKKSFKTTHEEKMVYSLKTFTALTHKEPQQKKEPRLKTDLAVVCCNCFRSVLMDLHWDFNQRTFRSVGRKSQSKENGQKRFLTLATGTFNSFFPRPNQLFPLQRIFWIVFLI